MADPKNTSPKKKRGKAQLTGQLWDEEGNRLWVAYDMGWNSVFWARVKSEAIIQACISIEPCSWIMFKIDHSAEIAFTKLIERLFKKRQKPSEYLVVRTKSPHNEKAIDSWFFIHGLDLNALDDKSMRYSDARPEIIDSEKLAEELKSLFEIKMHPTVLRTRRWSASGTTKHLLTLFRMCYLVQLAREGKDHPLTEGVPGLADFTARLARYIMHDRPLIYNLRMDQVTQLLEETEMLDDWQTVTVLKTILEYRKKKRERVLVYKGLPKAGAEIDRKEGKFAVREGKLSTLSIRNKKLTKEGLDWETVPVPKLKPEDEELEID